MPSIVPGSIHIPRTARPLLPSWPSLFHPTVVDVNRGFSLENGRSQRVWSLGESDGGGEEENGADGKASLPILSPGPDLPLEETVEANPSTSVSCFVFM